MSLNRRSESDARPNNANHQNWERFAIWSLVVVSFAALFVAGYVLWAKCHGK